MTTPPRTDDQGRPPVHTDSPPPTEPGLTTPGGAEPAPVLSQLGRYRILRQLGAGGMATVYLAEDTELDRLVAVKVPHLDPRHAAQLLERFQREARAAALLRHPNVCPVFDVGRIDGTPYLTMAYIEGRTLAVAADEYRRQGSAAIVGLVHTLALALADAHGHGVIHRDLKPSNIMITPRGEPVIMDFGLARRVDRDESRLTLVGFALGTPAYMPPEQVSGNVEAMGPAADVYSLGVILYELLTGRLPFEGSVTEVLAAVMRDDPPAPLVLRPDLDPRLDAICRACLARNIAQRIRSMQQLADALAEILAEPASGGRQPPVQAQQEADAPRSPDDLSAADEALELLRTWGWSMGVRKLKVKAQRTREARKRSAYQALLDVVGGEAEARAEASERLRGLPQWSRLHAWALTGEAAMVLRSRDYPRTHGLLDMASALAGDDPALRATLAHLRGTVLSHEGNQDEALPPLHEALTLFGRGHFAAGRVLDSLGMIHAARGQFHVAREFYEQAIRHKEQAEDEPGLAVSHGQLGRLFLDWGRLDDAERHFQIDLRLAQSLLDQRGEAQMYNHLGQVALAHAERELTAGRKSAAARRAAEAAGWLDGAVRLAVETRNPITEGYARKDRALTYLIQDDLEHAEEEVRQAEELFRTAAYADGTARANRVRGVLLRMQDRFDEATRRLRSALQLFESTGETAEAALTLWELARTQRAAGARPPLLTRAYLEALTRAESCRRGELVRRIEEELREVDHEAHVRHQYERARGAGFTDESDLEEGVGETATLLAVRLDGVTEATRELEPRDTLQTFNDLLADLEGVLVRQRATVLTYLGDGFLALCREARHAERAVRAALDLAAALEELNRPRRVLGLPPWRIRLAAATGAVVLGNVGTCRKTQPTVLGAAVGVVWRLLTWAEPGRPCVNRETCEAVRGRFRWPETPRPVPAAGAEECEVWDVLGVNE